MQKMTDAVESASVKIALMCFSLQLELRKKQFYLLINTIHELQQMLDGEWRGCDHHFLSAIQQ